MKIAVIGVKKIPTSQGKLEHYCQELYTRIADRGHIIDIFTQSKQSKHSWFSVRYYKNLRVITLLSLPGKRLVFWLNSALNTIWATFGNYDVIHIYGIKNAWFSWFAQLFSISKIVVTCQQLDYQKHQKNKIAIFWSRWLEKTVVKNTDEIVVDSKALETYFRQKYDVDSHHVPNPPRNYMSTDSKFSYGKALGLEKKRYILYLGTLEPEQKPDLLIKAFQQLDNSDWQLVLAGEIGNSPEYATRLLKVGQQKNIVFINETRGHFLAEIVRCAGLLIVPSNDVDLGLPLEMLEAMREGVPVLASDIAVHQEIISRDRGLLFTSGKLESLTSQLEYALSEPISLLNMAKRAQIYVAIHHNWDRVIYKNLFLYLKPITTIPTQPRKYRTFDN